MKLKCAVACFLCFGMFFALESCGVKKILDGKDGVYAVINTDKGNITLELFYKQAPLTVTNFVGLAEGTLDAAKGEDGKSKPFYDGLIFHRVIENFMIQTGDPNGRGNGGPGYEFLNEIVPELKHDKAGVLAMANSGPNTNGSQFYITHKETPWLDGDYSIFGQVVAGQDVVDKIEQGDVMKSVKIVRQGEGKNFKATQADFNNLLANATKANEKQVTGRQGNAELAASFLSGATKSADGTYYVITQKGAAAKAGAEKEVFVHYKGYFLNGETFDSSYERNEPIPFVTGMGQMISGFDKMVQDMGVGEKRTIVLSPEQAYGEYGAGKIPGNAYLVFDLELVSVEK